MLIRCFRAADDMPAAARCAALARQQQRRSQRCRGSEAESANALSFTYNITMNGDVRRTRQYGMRAMRQRDACGEVTRERRVRDMRVLC